MIDSLHPGPPDQSVHCLARIALSPVIGLDAVPDLQRALLARRVDARLPVEADVPDHQTAFLLLDDGARQPPLDIGFLPQLSEPATEEMLHSRVDRGGGKRRAEQLLRFRKTAGEESFHELGRHRHEFQPRGVNGRHVHRSNGGVSSIRDERPGLDRVMAPDPDGQSAWAPDGPVAVEEDPSEPRCKLCYAPFGKPGNLLIRVSAHKHPGGAEVEISAMFADIRGSTGLAEQLLPSEFGQLLTRFWGTAARVVDRWDGTLAVRSRPRESFSWRLATARARRGSRWASASTPASFTSATSGRATRSTSPP